MKNRLFILLNVICAAAVVGLLTAVPGHAAPAEAEEEASDQAATQDVVYTNDGRTLTGQIVEESRNEIVFEYVDRASGISTTLTLAKADIALIERDVRYEMEPDEPERPAWATSPARDAEDEDGQALARWGVRKNSDSEDATTFYIVPMKGQMGTDINAQVYEEVIESIKAVRPDVVVIEVDSSDIVYDDVMPMLLRHEQGIGDFDEYRELANLFSDELPRDIKQVVWIHNAIGFSALLSMSWQDMYMTPEAILGGISRIRGGWMGLQGDTIGKYREHLMAQSKSFLEVGGYPLVLADAMVRPEFKLSGTFRGRQVEWSPSTVGEIVADNSEEHTVSFRAKEAEDLCISDGTAETLDDLALLLGIREYRVLDGEAVEICDQYSENWRRTFEQCGEWLADYEKFLGWASGRDTLKYLGRAKQCLEKVLMAAERYRAVEIRLRTDYRVTTFDLQTMIEVLAERIRALNSRGRGGRGGGRGGGGLSGSR